MEITLLTLSPETSFFRTVLFVVQKIYQEPSFLLLGTRGGFGKFNLRF